MKYKIKEIIIEGDKITFIPDDRLSQDEKDKTIRDLTYFMEMKVNHSIKESLESFKKKFVEGLVDKILN